MHCQRKKRFIFSEREFRFRLRYVALCCAFLLEVLVGCADFPPTVTLSERPAHSLPNRQEQKALMVAARAYSTAETVSRCFGPDLWDAGFFPVVVYLENRGSNNFEFLRD